MRELPILFCPEMVMAAYEDRKSNTRRIEGLKILNSKPDAWTFTGWSQDGQALFKHAGFCTGIKPRYQVGDLLWVKETWGVFDVDAGNNGIAIGYKANPDDDVIWLPDKAHLLKGHYRFEKWRSSRFMFKAFARLWLRVTAIKDPHQIQTISEEDVKAEGCRPCSKMSSFSGLHYEEICSPDRISDARWLGPWIDLWNRLHPNPGERFEDHPWNFPYVFERIQR